MAELCDGKSGTQQQKGNNPHNAKLLVVVKCTKTAQPADRKYMSGRKHCRGRLSPVLVIRNKPFEMRQKPAETML
jgi:hypothetical protein